MISSSTIARVRSALRAGIRYEASDIAEAVGVSRTAVRDALRDLVARGEVERIESNRGKATLYRLRGAA